MARVFVTGGTGVIGRALLARLVGRGDDVVGLARSDEAQSALHDAGCSRVVRGEVFDVDAMAAGMEGCAVAYNLAGVNTLCVSDPEPMRRANVDGAVAAVHAAKRSGLARLIHTSSAATIGEAPGTIGNEWTQHRGWYLSTYEQTKTEGEHAAMAAARDAEQDVVYVNPSSVQGPGRASGTGRFLLAALDGRLPVFVNTDVSLVDIGDCVEGHLLAAEHGAPGERYLLSGIRLTVADALALAADVAGVQCNPRIVPRALATTAGTVAEYAFKLRGRKPPVCREMVRTLLHGHRYDGSRAERELGLRYSDPRDTVRRTVDWARAEGLLRNV
jgi:dihydroflavonol-4-reductase